MRNMLSSGVDIGSVSARLSSIAVSVAKPIADPPTNERAAFTPVFIEAETIIPAGSNIVARLSGFAMPPIKAEAV